MHRRTFMADMPLQALLLEQGLLLAQQLQQTAAAPDGQVLAAVEALAVPAARELARQAVEATLQAPGRGRRKNGRPVAPVPVDTTSGPRTPPAATC
jgi:hypothetical protein